MRDRYFSAKDIALMAVFGCASSLITLTTSFIPAPLPGLYAVIAIPVSTILTLTVVEMVRKFGAATFTQLVSGILSTFLPGGPPVAWIIIPVPSVLELRHFSRLGILALLFPVWLYGDTYDFRRLSWNIHAKRDQKDKTCIKRIETLLSLLL